MLILVTSVPPEGACDRLPARGLGLAVGGARGCRRDSPMLQHRCNNPFLPFSAQRRRHLITSSASVMGISPGTILWNNPVTSPPLPRPRRGLHRRGRGRASGLRGAVVQALSAKRRESYPDRAARG